MPGPYFSENKKLIFRQSGSDFELGMHSKCCCCGTMIISVINTNCVTDDNHDAYLNGTLLGSINLLPNAECTGRYFWAPIEDAGAPDPGYLNVPETQQCLCGPKGFDDPATFDKALIITGSNTFRLTISQVNGSGNFGVVKVGCYHYDTDLGEYVLDKLFVDSVYATNGPIGTNQDYTFDYP